MGLEFFAARLLCVDYFTDFPAFSKSPQTLVVELISLALDALPESRAPFFAPNAKAWGQVRQNLQSTLRLPFSRALAPSVDCRLLESDNLSLSCESAREALLLFRLLFERHPDRLFGKPLIALVERLNRADSSSSRRWARRATTLLFDRATHLLRRSRAFSLTDLFAFLRFALSPSEAGRPRVPKDWLDSLVSFCLGKLEGCAPELLSAGLAKEVFDLLTFLAKAGTLTLLLRGLSAFMHRFACVGLSGAPLPLRGYVPQGSPPTPLLRATPKFFFWKPPLPNDLWTTASAFQKAEPSILGDYLAQLASIFKELLIASRIALDAHFRELLALLGWFSVSCLQTDPLLLRGLHKALLRESRLALFNLTAPPSSARLRPEKVLFAQHFLDVTTAFLCSGCFSHTNATDLFVLLGSVFGQRLAY